MRGKRTVITLAKGGIWVKNCTEWQNSFEIAEVLQEVVLDVFTCDKNGDSFGYLELTYYLCSRIKVVGAYNRNVNIVNIAVEIGEVGEFFHTGDTSGTFENQQGHVARKLVGGYEGFLFIVGEFEQSGICRGEKKCTQADVNYV